MASFRRHRLCGLVLLSIWTMMMFNTQPSAFWLGATRTSTHATIRLVEAHAASRPAEIDSQSFSFAATLSAASAAMTVFGVRRMRRKAQFKLGGASHGEQVVIEPAPPDLRRLRLEAARRQQQAEQPWPAPANDRLLRAARGQDVDRPPKWMMRQAGRYLPEYQAVLAKHDFFEVCRTPELATEVTLQPLRRYTSLDSMIIFSDILVIPEAMGMACHMVPDLGPRFDFALETPNEIGRLNLDPNVEDALGYVFDAVRLTRERSGNTVPVIGFSGAPWTLMSYMIAGGASRSFGLAKKWIYLYPEASKVLLTALRDIIITYLVGQYDAGAPLLQIFDTNCGELPPHVYEEFCVPDLKYIAEEVKRQRPHALMSVFGKDGELQVWNDSVFDVVGVSWTKSPEQARLECPSKTLQGNLDPHILYAEPEVVKNTTIDMVKRFGMQKYIANGGHGMMPDHPPEGVRAFVEGVDSFA